MAKELCSAWSGRRTLRRDGGGAAPQPPHGKGHAATTEEMLRDLAFVLAATQKVKEAILAEAVVTV
jgi:hypothetical protein